MSASPDAPQPPADAPSSSPSRAPPDVGNEQEDTPLPFPNTKDNNKYNNWLLNTTIKTGKCRLCDERIKKHSWKCSICGLHLCNECSDENGSSGPKHKYMANSWLTTKCGCFYPSGQAPTLQDELEERGLVEPMDVNKRMDGMAKDKKIKAEVMRKKAEAQAKAATLSPTNDPVQPEAGSSKPKKQRGTVPTMDSHSWIAGPASDAVHDNDTYKGTTNADPTLTSGRAPRRNVKRKSYGELDVDDDDELEEYEPRHEKQPRPVKRTRQSLPVQTTRLPRQHLDNGHTVIIGAGVVGLFVAYELAITAVRARTSHRITVVEIKDNHSQLASGACAGLLTTHGLPKALTALARLAEECWSDMFSTMPGFADKLRLVEESIYAVARLDGQGRESKPAWYVGHELDTFVVDRWSMGKINTQYLTTWLFEACRNLGVDFAFNHVVDSTISSPNEDLTAVRIRHSIKRDQAPITVHCQNLVIAAGPWSTEIFNDLYDSNQAKLQNRVSIAYWHRLLAPSLKTKSNNVALLFPDITGGSEYLEPRVSLVAQPADDCIIISGIDARARNTDLGPMDALQPQAWDPKAARALKKIVRKRLTPAGQVDLDKAAVETTFDFICTADVDGLPIIDKVPLSCLVGKKVASKSEDARVCGVWLCYGLGMYGTTLAPAAAKVVARRIFGEESGVDDGVLGIPG